MKVHFIFHFSEKPFGGSFQFLKALKGYFQEQGLYEADIEKADIVLFNSYLFYEEIIRYKRKFPNLLFVHRIDGPMRLYNNAKDQRDKLVYALNNYIADATVFQTEWSKLKGIKMGLTPTKYTTQIINAPDRTIFNTANKKVFKEINKIKLIATSWSNNWKKGFQTYRWLDEHLDFEKYSMTFIGNSPIKLRNIQYIPPLSSEALAKQLSQHDIYITASEKDPCSNALLEAIHCGLPALAKNDGGHPEIIKYGGGELFDKVEDIIPLLKKMEDNYGKYQHQLPTIRTIGKEYELFLKKMNDLNKQKLMAPKQLSFGDKSYLYVLQKMYKIRLKFDL